MGTKICMNASCQTATTHEWKRGWPLRSGGHALLCYNCGSAYEDSLFCDTFHSEEPGWKECNICCKRLHCGCIASKFLLELLDNGGVGCVSCARSSQHHLQEIEFQRHKFTHQEIYTSSNKRPIFCSVVRCNEAMEGRENQDKASWTKDMLHTFCDICIKAIDKGMRPNTHFGKNGWKYVITTFKAMTGRSFTKKQLKNKWDGAKKDWRIWKKLIAENGVGWNSEIGTISASDEWWKAKIQDISGAKKFRHAGIEPSLCSKFDRMFSNIVATEYYAWTPSTGVLFDNDGGDDDNEDDDVGNDNGDDDANLEEGSGDSKEDVIPNFVDDVSNMVAGVNVANSSAHSSGKRKHREHSTQQDGRKSKGGFGIGAQLCSRFDRLVDSVLTKSEWTSSSRDKKGCSIEEVMAELHSIDSIIRGDDFHCYASELFCSRSKRVMWSTMGDLDMKLKWLTKMYERSLRSSDCA